MTFDTIWTFIREQVATNQFLTGATLTGLLMSVAYTLRSWLFAAYCIVKRFFHVSTTLHSEDPLYIPVSAWLYKNGFDKLARSYRMRYVDGVPTYGPDEGVFHFLYKRKLLRISITRDQQPTTGYTRNQTREYLRISYYSLRRSRKLLEEIVGASIEDYKAVRINHVSIYVFSGGYCQTGDIKKRDTPAVVLAGNTLQHIEEDIEKFFTRKGWYEQRGIPYHRGYLLTGPPGTGKTSLVRHLAQKFSLPLYVSDGSVASI